ncbi:MAG: undecaprenyl/decaprenyl-phosphate alpha-N-acetylglucosaminyl 1-phosphate transferase [Anaerolineales bacterium]|nr:undecaprenyl/decaprenyl-phosphate alpha-N-acetylglucosaminyl 1-phosphate transferase [Anaerolineales bacterium]
MTTTIFVFVLALSFALAGTPMVRRFAYRIGFLDQPAARKIQKHPIPLMGGVAIYAGVLLSILVLRRNYLPELASILGGATLVSLLGLWDDRVELPAIVKLAGQILTAVGLILAGVQISLGWLPVWINILLTILWVVGISNAINLLDNMDGLASGISAVASAYFMVIAAMNGQYLVSSLAAAVFGACLGFLVFNSQPASIFMGDAGSLFLGFTLAVIGIKLRFPNNVNVVTWMAPVLVMGVPIFDTTLVMISRIRRKVNPFTTAGKDHTSHRLVNTGMTTKEAVYTLYLVGCMLGLMAIFIMQANIIEAYTMGGVVFLLAVFTLARMEFQTRRDQ